MEQNELTKIIFTKQIDKILAATKDALEDIALDDKGTKITEHLNACAAKIEANLKKQLKSWTSQPLHKKKGAPPKMPVALQKRIM